MFGLSSDHDVFLPEQAHDWKLLDKKESESLSE